MIYALQEAIYSILQGLSVEVYDHVPQGTDYPFVVIGDALNNENDTDTETGFDGLLTITTYTSSDTQRGTQEVSAIMLEIYNLLHRLGPDDITVTGYGVSTINQEFSELLRDSDGITRSGVQRFRIYYEKTGV